MKRFGVWKYSRHHNPAAKHRIHSHNPICECYAVSPGHCLEAIGDLFAYFPQPKADSKDAQGCTKLFLACYSPLFFFVSLRW